MYKLVVILIQFQLLSKSDFLTTMAAAHDGKSEGMCPFEKLGNVTRRRRSVETESRSVCDLMKPRRGFVSPQTTPCPWKIFIYREIIEQLHAQPVTLGSISGRKIFNGYLLTARKLVTRNHKHVLGDFVGHFEPQWDVIVHCCGGSQAPNMLDGSLTARIKKPNQTVLWTAPKDYIGPFVFVATVWQTVSNYWFEIKSPIVHVIHRKS